MIALRHHLIAATVAASISAAVIVFAPIKQVVHTVNASKHAWIDLTDAQKADLTARLSTIPGLKLDIVCGDGACTDLAEDIDDAAEKAGVESILDHPVTPLGYGIGVKADQGDDRAQRVAAALSAATSGALQPVLGVDRTYGYAIIYIGKARKE
jgi:hypothetical protein